MICFNDFVVVNKTAHVISPARASKGLPPGIQNSFSTPSGNPPAHRYACVIGIPETHNGVQTLLRLTLPSQFSFVKCVRDQPVGEGLAARLNF